MADLKRNSLFAKINKLKMFRSMRRSSDETNEKLSHYPTRATCCNNGTIDN